MAEDKTLTGFDETEQEKFADEPTITDFTEVVADTIEGGATASEHDQLWEQVEKGEQARAVENPSPIKSLFKKLFNLN